MLQQIDDIGRLAHDDALTRSITLAPATPGAGGGISPGRRTHSSILSVAKDKVQSKRFYVRTHAYRARRRCTSSLRQIAYDDTQRQSSNGRHSNGSSC
jgi:hypothetical protein